MADDLLRVDESNTEATQPFKGLTLHWCQIEEDQLRLRFDEMDEDGRPRVDGRGGLGLVRLAKSKAKLIMDFLEGGGATVLHERAGMENAACRYY